HAVTAEWEAGNIFLPDKTIKPWVTQFVDEITTFPVGAHDDVVDAMTQALRDLYQKKRGISMNPDIINQAMHSRIRR
ncbi:phage terminase large subunit, partial [Xenorhabdus bovienii]